LTLLVSILIGRRPDQTAARIRSAVIVCSKLREGGQLAWLCGQHHHGEGACIIDRPASRRWDWHMSAVRLTLHTGLRVRGPGGGVR
jgi:hypothetical protein